jgi:hypothetical protein
MTVAVKSLLDYFDQLSESEKKEAATEILRRTGFGDYPGLSDDELISLADDLFLELDKEEAAS